MIPLCALLLAVTPARTAELVPVGASLLHVDGGFSALHIGGPVPVVPILTGDIEWARGLGAVDLRVRYTSHLGVVHRLGPELRGPSLRAGAFSAAARLRPSVLLDGALQDGLDYGGDVSTEAGVLATLRRGRTAFTLEAGLHVQWLVFERIDGESHVDDDPYLAFWDLAIEVERATSDDESLSARLEASIPRAPDDPFTVLGVYPRLVVGGSFGI